MDDTEETDLLCEALSILLRISVRSVHDAASRVRSDLTEAFQPTNRSVALFLPVVYSLFLIGVVTMVLRNQQVQYWLLETLAIVKKLAKNLRKMLARTYHTLPAMVAGAGGVAGVRVQMAGSAGSCWDMKGPSGNSACYALQGRRPKMEDRFTLIEKLANTPLQLFAIYDGHGGEVRVWRKFKFSYYVVKKNKSDVRVDFYTG